MKILNVALVASGLFSVGCGGGGGGAQKSAGVGAGSFGPNTVSVAAITASELSVVVDGDALTLPKQLGDAHDTALFTHYHSENPEIRGYAAQTSNSRIGVVSEDGNDGNGGIFFQNLAAAPLIPTTGSASYTGDYAGLLRSETDLSATILTLVKGDASVTVNFANSSVSGRISGRQALQPSNAAVLSTVQLSDVVLQNGVLDVTGAINGSVTGGQSSVGPWTGEGGNFGGQLTGPFASEAIGGVEIDYTLNGTQQLKEIGAFQTSR